MHIQPEEGITLRFGAKVPGPLVRLGAVNMNFAYADYVRKALPARSFPNYAAGTWGPAQADELLQRDRRQWWEIPR